ncbi:MAG: SGNH/GDSL hydrolase family protein [Bacteroidales bacterium]|nr:SGNH/GDSL hydrolase family protein [Bacteroidales bacterium]
MTGWQFIKRLFFFAVIFIITDYFVSNIFLNGINKYFGLENQPEILINGSSMILAGFDKSEIENRTGKNVALYSRPGVSLADRSVMIEHFFDLYPENVEAVIFEVNPLIFSNRFSAENVYTLFYPYIDNPAIDTYIRNRASQKEYIVHKYIRATRYDIQLIKSSINGYLNNYTNIKTQVLDTNALEGLRRSQNTQEIEFDEGKIKLFEKTIDLIRKQGAEVILINMPMYTMKFKTFRSSDYERYISYFDSYSSSNDNVMFLDLNTRDISTRNKNFSDPLHLNREGEKVISSRIIEVLNN